MGRGDFFWGVLVDGGHRWGGGEIAGTWDGVDTWVDWELRIGNAEWQRGGGEGRGKRAQGGIWRFFWGLGLTGDGGGGADEIAGVYDGMNIWVD